mmetsp:Transcript_6139/g.10153  ORF Transcript_6139/g.10153 Transcript_6139/m.10153 type:complete len:87 (-) Transcript_6139:691-951(-)
MDHPVRSPTDQDENVCASPATTMIFFCQGSMRRKCFVGNITPSFSPHFGNGNAAPTKAISPIPSIQHIEEASSLPSRMIHVEKCQW